MSWHFDRHLRQQLLKLPFDAALEKELATLSGRMGRITNWSYFSQFAITLLAAAAFLAMLART